jgi:hypothetical protein
MEQSHQSFPQKQTDSYSSPITSSPTNSNRSMSPFFFKDDDTDLPIFDGQLPIFALDRSLSPISLQPSDYNTRTTPATSYISDLEFSDEEGFISLSQIHELIGTPKECDQQEQRLQQLETIFEGIFLETPPRGDRNKKLNSIEPGFLKKPKLQRKVFQDNMENESPLDENQQD